MLKCRWQLSILHTDDPRDDRQPWSMIGRPMIARSTIDTSMTDSHVGWSIHWWSVFNTSTTSTSMIEIHRRPIRRWSIFFHRCDSHDRWSVAMITDSSPWSILSTLDLHTQATTSGSCYGKGERGPYLFHFRNKKGSCLLTWFTHTPLGREGHGALPG